MSRPTIYADYHEGNAKVSPVDFLGPEQFKVYRDICRSNGSAFVPGLSSNLVRLDLLPALLKRLEDHFTIRIAERVIGAAQARARAILEARSEARDRVSKMNERPYPFQEVGIKELASRNSFILADEMGLGKTVQALLAIETQAAVLVVCPASLKGEWVKATARWRPDLAATILERFRWPKIGEVAIINYDRLPVLNGLLSKRSKNTVVLNEVEGLVAGTYVIADECHYVKSAKSLRTKYFRALAKMVRAYNGRTWGLTGTPMPSTPMDLLNILTAFDLLRDSFGSFPGFLKMMNGKQDYWGNWVFGTPRPEATQALRRVMLRRRREEVLPDLPTITYQTVDVDVTAAARQASDEARAAMAAAGVSWEEIASGQKSLGAASDSVFTARRLLAEAKTAAVADIVKQYQEAKEPLIVFSAHLAPIKAVASMAGCGAVMGDDSSIDRSDTVARFQSGKLDAIALTIRSGGIGFTLTRGSHVLMVDEEWTPDWNDQAVSRACRIGQTRGVLVKRLVAPDTVDEDLARILATKRKIIDATIEKASGEVVSVTEEELLGLARYA